MSVLKFPDDWPAGCPPTDAVDAAGDVYRLVRSDPPTDRDLASHWETGQLPRADACLRCGLSVFRGEEEARHQRKLFPKLGGFIAGATLHADHGKTKLTKGQQPTHTTWWAYDGVNRAGLFSVVEEST